MAITQEKNIEMLEKLPDGNFKIKYPKTKAENVLLVDANNNFIATNVEGALNELFTNVSSGKNLLETAIIDKKGTVSKVGEVATFEELKFGIANISTGQFGLPMKELLSYRSMGSIYQVRGNLIYLYDNSNSTYFKFYKINNDGTVTLLKSYSTRPSANDSWIKWADTFVWGRTTNFIKVYKIDTNFNNITSSYDIQCNLIYFDDLNNIYAFDLTNKVIRKYNSNGVLQTTIDVATVLPAHFYYANISYGKYIVFPTEAVSAGSNENRKLTLRIIDFTTGSILADVSDVAWSFNCQMVISDQDKVIGSPNDNSFIVAPDRGNRVTNVLSGAVNMYKGFI